jgi:membrane-bound acyltransferase YfiQ involved in biofilm formation
MVQYTSITKRMVKKENDILKDESFSLNTTNCAKGIALLLLLWHHLFYEHPENHYLVYYTASLAKVCVAIFLILSGYGLSHSIQRKPMGLWAFYKHVFSRIYLNYWYIAIFFVPVAIYFFNRPITGVFETKPYLKFFIQMLGYHMYFKDILYGFNPTWWYISVIFGLYWLFPFIFSVLKRYGVWAFILVAAFVLSNRTGGIAILYLWVFPFMLGIYLALNNGFERISSILKKIGWMRYLIVVILIVLIALLRLRLLFGFMLLGVRLNPIWLDGLFGTVIIILVFELTQQFAILESGLAFLGTHLFNIFLFHTFIFYFFFPDFIYSFKNPVLIFLVLLVLCLGISCILELTKKLVGLEKIQRAIDRISIRDRYIID